MKVYLAAVVITLALLIPLALSQQQNQIAPPPPEGMTGEGEVAYFAAGCFWCVESDFEHHEGVLAAISGYMGGHVNNPSYEQVSLGQTGHREAVLVRYDPAIISYQELLDIFGAFMIRPMPEVLLLIEVFTILRRSLCQ
ncbi:MAG: peptide-methionine (S)-S-oxide reductase [Deinococcales bacterium]